MISKEIDKYIFFSYAQGVGPKTFLKLQSFFKSVDNIYNASEKELISSGFKGKNLENYLDFKSKFDIGEINEKLEKAKVQFIPSGSAKYPKALKKLPDPPIGLFAKGNIGLLSEKNNIGVVGARKITSYGRAITKQIVASLVRNHIAITSGLAMGVDGVAHRTCLENNGKTIAVLGCGVDCPYPRENEKLYEQILDAEGLIISEYPLGMSANQGTFPARNRIIAALSRAVLITEAAQDSGSLITAKRAFEQEKTVFAVPGPITSRMSKGSSYLLKNGGILVTEVEDILKELSVKQESKRADVKTKDPILKILLDEPRSTTELVRLSGKNSQQVGVYLSRLELLGKVVLENGKWEIKA